MCVNLFAQKNAKTPNLTKEDYVVVSSKRDSIKERDRASQILRGLKDGCLIVRIKTNQKSIAAYRNSGNANIADRIEEERRKQNENMVRAFTAYFNFCRVYFLYSHETQDFLDGNRKIFLNAKMEHDSTILFKDSFYLFCEYGSAVPYSNFNDNPESSETGESFINKHHPQHVETSTDVATNSSLVLYDKNLRQLARPFPYAEGVYLDNFGASVRTLEKELERAYSRLVLNRDMQESIKKMKQKMNEQK